MLGQWGVVRGTLRELWPETAPGSAALSYQAKKLGRSGLEFKRFSGLNSLRCSTRRSGTSSASTNSG